MAFFLNMFLGAITSCKSYSLINPDHQAGSCSWPCLARTANSCFSMPSAPWRVWADFSSWPAQNDHGQMAQEGADASTDNATHGWLWSIVHLQGIHTFLGCHDETSVVMFFLHLLISNSWARQWRNKPWLLKHVVTCLDISFQAARFLNANSWQNFCFFGAFEMGLWAKSS